MKFLLLFSAAGALLLCGCASRPPLQTVPKVDLKRYSGEWHEVARYPNWFQRNCDHNTTATYLPNPGGSITVINRCFDRKGKPMEVRGTATVVPNTGNSRLKVKLGGPFAGDYWIIGLDNQNYQWAVVGHPSRRFLWFLARDPEVSPAAYRRMQGIAAAQGYDLNRIERSSLQAR